MPAHHFSKEIWPDHHLRLEWVHRDCPVPAIAAAKHEALLAYGEWAGAKVLVETGTFEGETCDVLKSYFDLLYTIEGDKARFEEARARLSKASNVKCLFGDSAKAISFVLAQLRQKAVFWLDAHWCGKTTYGEVYSAPIMEELEAVFAHSIKNHVILIDDARFFVGHYGYPSIDYLRRWVAERRPELTFDIAMDIIRIHEPLPPVTP